MNNLLTQKFPIAAFALLFVLTMSCSHDPHDENQDPSNTDVHEWEDSTLSGDAVMGSAMTFKVGGGMSVERTAQTRVTTDINGTANFTEGDLVAVAVTRSGGSEVIKLYQVKSDGSLEYAGGDNNPFVWKSASETVSLRAWSYGTSTNLSYTLTAPETRDYTLETDQQTNGYRELLYCKAADKSYSSGAISLNFYHQLARVVFNVTHELSGALTISSVSIGGSSFPKTARFNVPMGSSNVGTWVVKSGTGSITPRTETPPTTGYLATYSAVVFPTFTTQNYPKDTPFFTVTSGTNNYTYKIAESGGMAYDGNTQYNYTINVKDDVLIFYPSTYTAADITYGDYYSVTSTGQPVLVKNSSVTDAINAGITPIAVVFSTTTSSTDKSHGWTHGYALALKNATNSAVTWSSSASSKVQTTQYPWKDGLWTTYIQNMDGYTETHHITDNASYKATLQTSFPAFYYAINYPVTAPPSSSGWYLPSIGQWYYIFVNLCGMTTSTSSITSATDGVLGDYHWSGTNISTSCSNAIDNYCKVVGAGNYDLMTGHITWHHSSEADAAYAIRAEFGGSQMDFYNTWAHKTNTAQMVRSVLAF